MNRYTRRTPDQWKAFVAEQAASPLSAPQFCKENDIAYVSFSKWRKKLEPASTLTSSQASGEPAFVELSVPDSAEQTKKQWHIELDLAPGVQLRIAR